MRFSVRCGSGCPGSDSGIPGGPDIEGPLLAEYNARFDENPERADFNIPPVLFCWTRKPQMTSPSTWQAAVDRTVAGLGYELVDLERSGGGLLRVTIDRVPGRVYPTGEGDSVLVEDCEAVTRQLQYVLEVEGADYARLEVSSPGLDRQLRREADYARFAGNPVDLTLKLPLDGRRKFKGVLERREGGWRLALESPPQKGQPQDAAPQALDFALDEVREARLVPVLDFKGRRVAKPAGQ
jgi:ribosome maturation factor RimP